VFQHQISVVRCRVDSSRGIPDTPMTHNNETLFVFDLDVSGSSRRTTLLFGIVFPNIHKRITVLVCVDVCGVFVVRCVVDSTRGIPDTPITHNTEAVFLLEIVDSGSTRRTTFLFRIERRNPVNPSVHTVRVLHS
jgi:hypothetical protein